MIKSLIIIEVFLVLGWLVAGCTCGLRAEEADAVVMS
jgi:hypothetical protein